MTCSNPKCVDGRVACGHALHYTYDDGHRCGNGCDLDTSPWDAPKYNTKCPPECDLKTECTIPCPDCAEREPCEHPDECNGSYPTDRCPPGADERCTVPREPCEHCNDTGTRERSDGEMVGCGYCTVPTSDPCDSCVERHEYVSDTVRDNPPDCENCPDYKPEQPSTDEEITSVLASRKAKPMPTSDGGGEQSPMSILLDRAEQLEAENATLRARVGELEEVEVKHQSLLTELWSGVRVHGLNGNIGKRDGERLIHAYCGGIVTVMNELEEARIDLAKMTPVIQDVEYLWRFRHDDIAHLPEKFEEHDEQDFVDMLMDTFMAYQYAVEASKYEKS